jgi:hypothetical protein
MENKNTSIAKRLRTSHMDAMLASLPPTRIGTNTSTSLAAVSATQANTSAAQADVSLRSVDPAASPAASSAAQAVMSSDQGRSSISQAESSTTQAESSTTQQAESSTTQAESSGVTIPRAVFEAHNTTLAGIGIFEGMPAPSNPSPGPRYGPQHYPIGPFAFPRVRIADPLRPRYQTNEFTSGDAEAYVHKQTHGSKLTILTDDDGKKAVQNTIKHYAAHMHKQKQHVTTPVSAPQQYGETSRSFRLPWNGTQPSLDKDVISRKVLLSRPSTSAQPVDTRRRSPSKLKMLPRFKAATTLPELDDAVAEEAKVWVCPEPCCGQHFHPETTREMIIHHLMYDNHTSYSYHKSENLCPFGCRKGFYDEDLLKEHIRMRQCLIEDESSEIVEEVEEVTDLETGPYGCVPCSLGFPTTRDLSIHIFRLESDCNYIDDSLIQIQLLLYPSCVQVCTAYGCRNAQYH